MTSTVHPTLLDRLVREANWTIEETRTQFERAAREMGEDATLSKRQLLRWMKGDVGRPLPVARRVAERFWGHPMEALLGPAEVTLTTLAVNVQQRLPSDETSLTRGEPEAGDNTDRRKAMTALAGAARGVGLNSVFASQVGMLPIDAETLRAPVTIYRRVEQRMPSRSILAPATAHLGLIRDVLARNPGEPGMYAVLSEAAGLAAWLYADLDDRANAPRHYQLAITRLCAAGIRSLRPICRPASDTTRRWPATRTPA